ncbi:hypothetical protein DdX_15047 [Ditylenchus destructor]|uniref:Uncharacterized protein n=1 Tax=Ditylenchus destructor TaxID=166010 RepID=A0AAD4MTH6_9BILA|nr:hypothetical protein DdX_15047 [Ditylenchus destructor]
MPIHRTTTPIVLLIFLPFIFAVAQAGSDLEEFDTLQSIFEDASGPSANQRNLEQNNHIRSDQPSSGFNDHVAAALPLPDQNGAINSLQGSSSVPSNLFKEYLSRGLYTCTSKYVSTIAKLHSLIRDAYEEFSSCQKLMKDAHPTFMPTQFDVLDDLLEEWQNSEETATNAHSESDNHSQNSGSEQTEQAVTSKRRKRMVKEKLQRPSRLI